VQRDLQPRPYNDISAYLKHPTLILYGTRLQIALHLCLWPQTVGGPSLSRALGRDVVAEMKWAKAAFPTGEGIFFDDDTLTDNLRASKRWRRTGQAWCHRSCNAKAMFAQDLEILKDNGLRLFLSAMNRQSAILVNIKKACAWMSPAASPRTVMSSASSSTAVHSSLPGETKDTIQETMNFAKEINPHTIQIPSRLLYPARSSTGRRRKMAGSTMRKSIF